MLPKFKTAARGQLHNFCVGAKTLELVLKMFKKLNHFPNNVENVQVSF